MYACTICSEEGLMKMAKNENGLMNKNNENFIKFLNVY